MRMNDATIRTRNELAAYLHDIGVNTNAYHLFGAHLDEAFVLDRRPEGWTVFYSERGGENVLSVHRDEADACRDLLARLTKNEHVFFELVAGPAPAAVADGAFDKWLRQRGTGRSDLDPTEWKSDQIPWTASSCRRRYFVRITTARRINEST